MSGRGRSGGPIGPRHRAPVSGRLIWTRRLGVGGAALLAAVAVVTVIGMSGGSAPAPARSDDGAGRGPVAGSFPPDGGGRPDPAVAGPGAAGGAGAGLSGAMSPGGAGSGSGGSGGGRPDEGRSGGDRSARSAAGGSTGPTPARPTIAAAAGPSGPVTVGSGAADWLVLAAGANGTVTRPPDPAVRLGYEHRNARLWRDGPFRVSFTGGTPVADLRDTPRWMLLSADGGRVELTVPALDRQRSLVLYVGGADAVVTAGSERAVVPGTATATVTVTLPPSSGPTPVAVTPAGSERGDHIGIAAVELR